MITVKRAFDSLIGKKPVPELSTGAAVAGQSQETITSVSLVETDNAANAVLAERKRIFVISSVASPSQAEMRDRLIADGTPADDAVLALRAAMPAAAEAPVVTEEGIANAILKKFTEEGVAKAMFKQLNSVALPSASTLAQDDKNVLEQFKDIKDPRASAEFYNQHKAEIDRLSNQQLKTEGK